MSQDLIVNGGRHGNKPRGCLGFRSLHVAAYIRALGKDFEKPSVKQHLAAIRMLFD